MLKQTVRKVALTTMLGAAVSCGAKTGLKEPLVEARSVSCADALSRCTTQPITVRSTMLPDSTDVTSRLNNHEISSRFTSLTTSSIATAAITFEHAVRVDVFNPNNQISFPIPGPTPNYLEVATVLELTPDRVVLSFGSNLRPISIGGERVYKCLRFRVSDSSTQDVVSFGVYDSTNAALSSGSVASGQIIPFTAANRRLFLGNYAPEGSDRFGFVLFANVVEITPTQVRLNSNPQSAISGNISSDGSQVTGFSVSMRNGNFTDCQ